MSFSPLAPQYDIVFAGGGPCSCIAASRLLEMDPSLKIMIIEYGPHTRNIARHIQPAQSMRIQTDSTIFHYHVGKPATSLGGRAPIVPSGKAVGGGSSVNFMSYTRAAASDYDDWENRYHNPGWGSESLIPLLKKAETYQEVDVNGTHGTTGPIKVSFAPDLIKVAEDFLDAARVSDTDRQSTDDTNGFYECNKYGRWARYIDKVSGTRSDVPHHYIYNKPENKNLTILTESVVDCVIFQDGRAVGVKYKSLNQPDADALTISATKFVVLGAGALGSPAILERSGIGSAKVLQQAGIPQVVDLPGVGENYMDHNLTAARYHGSPDIETLDEISYGDEEQLSKHTKIWSETGGGLMSHNGTDAMIKLRPNPKDLECDSSDLTDFFNTQLAGSPDKPLVIMGTVAAFMGGIPPSAPTFKEKNYLVSYWLAYPISKGYIHITSSDPLSTQKDFHPSFLDHPGDIAALRWTYKKSRELGRRMACYRGKFPQGHPEFDHNSPAVVVVNDGPHGADEPPITYSEEDNKHIDDYHRKTVQTTWHSCGTCAMKPRADGGVVDPRLNVYGVQGLKVADCSIFPANVGANTYNSALAIGEKAALLLAEDLGFNVQ